MTIGKLIVQRDNIVSYDNFIFKILDDMPVREALKYQNDEEKNEFFNSFIYRVVLFDDCVYIFYNTSPDAPTKVKLDKEELDELKSPEHRKSTRLQPLGFKLGANGGETGICSCLLQSNPCEIFLCFAKAFGQPLKTTHRVVFLTLSFKSLLLSGVKQNGQVITCPLYPSEKQGFVK